MKGRKDKKSSKKRAKAARRASVGTLDALLESLRGEVHSAVSNLLGDMDRDRAVLEIAALAGEYCDEVVGSLSAKAFRKSDPRACAPGCSWCCHQLVTASPPTVFFLGHALTSSGPTCDGIMADTRSAAKLVRGLRARDRLRLRLACPLLAEDGTCAVYPVRPLACRGWNTYDAQACRRSIEAPESAPEARVHVPQVRVAHAVESGVIEALEAAGLKAAPVELIGALALVLDDASVEPRWLDGEDVFEGLRPISDEPHAAAWFAHGHD